MRRWVWEYKIVATSDGKDGLGEGSLNALGSDGWEMVGVWPAQGGREVTVYFKRLANASGTARPEYEDEDEDGDDDERWETSAASILYHWSLAFICNLKRLGLSARVHDAISNAAGVWERRFEWSPEWREWVEVISEPYVLHRPVFSAPSGRLMRFEEWSERVASGGLRDELMALETFGPAEYRELVARARQYLELGRMARM